MKSLNIKIFESVGPFMFGENINTYSKYQFEYIKASDVTNWDVYKYNGIISIYTENYIIVSIACYADCKVLDFLLIGANFQQFLNRFNIDSKLITYEKIYIQSDDDYQDVYDIQSLGMQIWVKNDLIETAIVSPHIYD